MNSPIFCVVGNKNPSSEEIINAILDIQERSNTREGAEEACGSSNGKYIGIISVTL